MKKRIACLLGLTLVLGLAGCGTKAQTPAEAPEEAQEEKQKALGKPWKLQIAHGYAVHKEESSYEDLFRLADDRMYECKRRMKENSSCHTEKNTIQ